MLRSPLLPYHFDRHRQAGPIILKLFEMMNSKSGNEQRDRLLSELQIINCEIRGLNTANTVDAELGTVDIHTFLYAWSMPDGHASGRHLEEFCRLHYYPTQWACRPPVIGGGYDSCPDKYWESCDWNTAGKLLGFVWTLRKAKAKDEIIDSQEMVLLRFEPDFNKSLRRLHQAYNNRGSANHFLRAEELLGDYQTMIKCLEMENREGYERRREEVQRKSALYGYPRRWTPSDYCREKRARTFQN